jgi:class 3 adenylate cyclase
MKLPSTGRLAWTALVLAVFFGVVGVAQYYVIDREIRNKVMSDLDDEADQINEVAAFDKGIDLEQYNRAFIDADDYFVVLSKGRVLDIESASKGMLKGILPKVQAAFPAERAIGHPFVVQDRLAGHVERWTVLAKKLEGGIFILGTSEFDHLQSVSEVLRRNLAKVGDKLSDIENFNPSRLDNTMHWAALSDSGELITAFGRIPLQTDPMAIGQRSATSPETKISNKPYLVLYSPLTDKSGSQVGTIILPADISKEKGVLRTELIIHASIAVVSFILFLAFSAWDLSKNEGEKRAIREAFQKYLSPSIMDAILREPHRLALGGQRREVTILFADIRSFTELSEQLPPQQLTRLLQDYFEAMTDEVLKEDGILDKYIGDAIMAFWGAPIEQADQADRAVRAAHGMIRRLKELQEKWRAEGLPIFNIGIGINLGIATVGNMGSSKRFDYTVVGDTVNAASRLESLAKDHTSHIIISESTKTQLTIGASLKDLGEVQVRGKERSIRVYEVLAA